MLVKITKTRSGFLAEAEGKKHELKRKNWPASAEFEPRVAVWCFLSKYYPEKTPKRICSNDLGSTYVVEFNKKEEKMLHTTPITSNASEIIKRFRRSMRRRNVCRIDADRARRFIKFLRFYGLLIYIRNGKLFIGEFSTLFGENKFLVENSDFLRQGYKHFCEFNHLEA